MLQSNRLFFEHCLIRHIGGTVHACIGVGDVDQAWNGGSLLV